MGNNLGPFPSASNLHEGKKQGVGAVGGTRTTYWSENVIMVLNMLETCVNQMILAMVNHLGPFL